MRKERRSSPTESPLLFEVDSKPIEETLTAFGGIPLVVQAFRSLGLPKSISERVHVKERDRGYDEATFVESFVILNAAGGECVDDFQRLRDDAGLADLIGHDLPSASAALQFLYAFHEEEKIAEAKQQRLPGQIAYIPEETPKKDTKPLRYVAIRIRKKQGELFDDGSAVRHFAVLSNRWELKAAQLIEWHREKAGTIELVHDILKNDLAAGVLPSKYFGANAAWLRLAVISKDYPTLFFQSAETFLLFTTEIPTAHCFPGKNCK